MLFLGARRADLAAEERTPHDTNSPLFPLGGHWFVSWGH